MYNYMMTCISKNNPHFHTKRGHVNNMCINVYQFHACRSQCSPSVQLLLSDQDRDEGLLLDLSVFTDPPQPYQAGICCPIDDSSTAADFLTVDTTPQPDGFCRSRYGKGCAVEVINQNEPELRGHLAIAGYTKVGGGSWLANWKVFRWDIVGMSRKKSSKSWSWHHTPCYTIVLNQTYL